MKRTDFNPRSSCEERRPEAAGANRHGADFNPRSSCEERLRLARLGCRAHISIHAPHARSDDIVLPRLEAGNDFNPRSSCEERLLSAVYSCLHLHQFQSTLLMRGATAKVIFSRSSGISFQSTLLMRGATWRALVSFSSSVIFQSTLLMRGATA